MLSNLKICSVKKLFSITSMTKRREDTSYSIKCIVLIQKERINLHIVMVLIHRNLLLTFLQLSRSFVSVLQVGNVLDSRNRSCLETCLISIHSLSLYRRYSSEIFRILYHHTQAHRYFVKTILSKTLGISYVSNWY